MVPQQYCLRWKHHHSNVQSMFTKLLEKERFCDVTLYCSPSFVASQSTEKDCLESSNLKGVSLRAHRVVLAACSEMLASLLGAHEALGEPVLVIDGAEPEHVRALLDYMYKGEMNVHHSQLAGLLKTAEELRIKGLTDIRWNNKDEPPDEEGSVTATATNPRVQVPKASTPDRKSPEKTKTSPETILPDMGRSPSPESVKSECDKDEKCSVNGGPPPLIKLPVKDMKTSPLRVRKDLSDTESSSPKRQRLISGADHTDDDTISQPKSEREQDWQHGNLDISAERVSSWFPPDGTAPDWSGGSEDEWDNPPTDIASFLHTRLKVDGDNSNDDDSTLEGTGAPSRSSTIGIDLPELRLELSNVTSLAPKHGKSLKSAPFDPRFPDVVKLNDYLQHGRRPQFWEENYVKRVMEAVRTKELEMKQAAEILGVSYGTLYGRYRDVYGCINRPYTTPRAGRDVWIPKGPSEVLERLQRGEVNIETASIALGVNPAQLAAYVSGVDKKEFEPIPIEVESPKKLPQAAPQANINLNNRPFLKNLRKIASKSLQLQGGNLSDDDTSSNTGQGNSEGNSVTTTSTAAGVWPSIRVANLDTLRSDPILPPTISNPPSTPNSPSHLMRTRPDLTIVATKKPDDRT